MLFSPDGTVTTPSTNGTFSASLGAGWRFVIKRVFIEPYVRGGYPYLYGGGLTAGIRF